MIYNEAAGGFLDAAYFMVYYCSEDYIKTYLKYHYNSTKYLSYYYEAKEMIGSLPMEIQPFCYGDYKYVSVITASIHGRNVKVISKETVENYLHTKYYLSKLFKSWFGNYTDDIPNTVEELKKIDCFALADRLPVAEDVRYRVAKVFDNFEAARAKLIEVYFEVYEKILRLRERYKDAIQFGSRFYNQPDIVKELGDKFKIEVDNFDYAVVLINAILLYTLSNRKVAYIGINLIDVLGDQSSRITPASFVLAYRDPIRARIIKIAASRPEVTIAELAELLGEKSTTLDRHICVLLDACIIDMSRIVGEETFYILNPNYFKILSENFGKTVEDLLN